MPFCLSLMFIFRDNPNVLYLRLIFDNILKCCKLSNDDWMTSIGEYIEILFGCIIVYQMYIYDVHPSAHFYKLSFTQNEFWKQVMDVYFEYYVGLLLHIKDQRLHSSNKKKTKNNKLLMVNSKYRLHKTFKPCNTGLYQVLHSLKISFSFFFSPPPPN